MFLTVYVVKCEIKRWREKLLNLNIIVNYHIYLLTFLLFLTVFIFQYVYDTL